MLNVSRIDLMAMIVGVCLGTPMLCEATGGLRLPRGPSDREIKIPIRPEVPVPEGKQVEALYYQVSDDQEITLRRTLTSQVPFLGVQTAVVQEQGVDGNEPFVGLRVTAVEPESAADLAGILTDDLILELNGVPVSHPGRLSHVIRVQPLDRPLLLELQRGSRTLSLEVMLGSEPLSTDDYEPIRIGTIRDQHAGFTFGTLDDRLRRYLVEPGESGVVVMSIMGGTPAFYSRVRVGDVLVSPSGGFTDSAEAFANMLARAADSGSSIRVTARRGPKVMEDTFRPLRSLPGDVSFKLPLLCDWKKGAEYTDLDLVLGILFGYERHSSVLHSVHRQTRSWGAVLNLIHYRSAPERKTFRLLWLIKFSW